MATQQIPDPLESSRRKVTRAEEHFGDLQRKVNEFGWSNPYARVVEPHPDKANHVVHKIKVTKEIPAPVAEIVADVAQNLRNALDNAAYAVAVAAGNPNPKNCSFPFAKSAADMVSSIGRAKDLPLQIQSLFCGFQPYLGGNELLWALNEICITDKHMMLIPIGNGVFRASANVSGTGYFSMPDPHVWNRAKNEMEIITLGPGAEYKCDFDFRLFVAFNEIQIVDGQPVPGVLERIGCMVNRILLGMEAEARRLGYFK